jgi:uncharacterized protein YyaL (SSP411 family)
VKLAENTYFGLQRILFKDNQWYHCARQGQLSDNILCEDYAAIIYAEIALYCATGKTIYCESAESSLHFALDHFYNTDNYLFHLRMHGNHGLIANPQPLEDSATPSCNGLMARNAALLFLLTGNVEYQQLIFDMSATLHEILKSPQALYFSSICLALAWIEKGKLLKTGMEQIAKDSKEYLLSHKPMLTQIFEDGQEHMLLCDAVSCNIFEIEPK